MSFNISYKLILNPLLFVWSENLERFLFLWLCDLVIFLSKLVGWLSELSSIDIDIILIDFSLVLAVSILEQSLDNFLFDHLGLAHFL